jgi:hypothetical protein
MELAMVRSRPQRFDCVLPGPVSAANGMPRHLIRKRLNKWVNLPLATVVGQFHGRCGWQQ